MFRKRNGSMGFLIGTFMNNAFPNLAADPHRYDHIPALGKDLFYAHQLASSGDNTPFALDERSLFVGGVCDSDVISSKVFQKLQKVGVINEQDCVDTRYIDGKKFPHQGAVLSVFKQRELINLLFWWEEECVRLKKLVSEANYFDKNISALQAGEALAEHVPIEIMNDDEELKQLIEHLRFEREKNRMRISQQPSERRADIENGTDNLYAEVQSVPDVRLSRQEADLPSYRP